MTTDYIYTLAIFQENGSGEKKTEGINLYGHDLEIISNINIKGSLPEFIDDPEDYLGDDLKITANLVLNFLKHPDLSYYLVDCCQKNNIPVITAGKKIEGAICPFTCCGLSRNQLSGPYGEQFGFPEFKVILDKNNDKITELKIYRGASCGATWEAADSIIGMNKENAVPTLAREVQYLCCADPSAFDPISGKSSLHYAGDVHAAALKKGFFPCTKKIKNNQAKV
jgi:thymidylate synthase